MIADLKGKQSALAVVGLYRIKLAALIDDTGAECRDRVNPIFILLASRFSSTGQRENKVSPLPKFGFSP